ncbi:MAG: hypothetical protein GX799_00655 [Crenarchaeota archaeon]|nr:hypothetical protein [Thermoproteota archaeon]
MKRHGVDLYIYDGYWNGSTNNTYIAKDTYPILDGIVSANTEVKGNEPHTQVFSCSTVESHTLFFIFPLARQSTFHVTLKQVQ